MTKLISINFFWLHFHTVGQTLARPRNTKPAISETLRLYSIPVSTKVCCDFEFMNYCVTMNGHVLPFVVWCLISMEFTVNFWLYLTSLFSIAAGCQYLQNLIKRSELNSFVFIFSNKLSQNLNLFIWDYTLIFQKISPICEIYQFKLIRYKPLEIIKFVFVSFADQIELYQFWQIDFSNEYYKPFMLINGLWNASVKLYNYHQ